MSQSLQRGTVKVMFRMNEDFMEDDILVKGTTNRPEKVRHEFGFDRARNETRTKKRKRGTGGGKP